MLFFFFQAEDGIRDLTVTGVQTCALPISRRGCATAGRGYGARRRGAAAQLLARPRARSPARVRLGAQPPESPELPLGEVVHRARMWPVGDARLVARADDGDERPGGARELAFGVAEPEAGRRPPAGRHPQRVDRRDAPACELDREPVLVEGLVGEVPGRRRATAADAVRAPERCAHRGGALAEPDPAERAS